MANRDWTANVTVLSGDIDDNDETTNGVVVNADDIRGSNSYNVVTGSGTNASAVLDGLTVTGGQANGEWPVASSSGGGVYSDSGSPTLRNVTISGNYAHGGGGMANRNSHPTLTGVTISGNSADEGGGMWNQSSSPTLTNVAISGNSVHQGWGGGMYNAGGSPTLVNVAISGNSAHGGGGIFNALSNPTLTNVVISGNWAKKPNPQANDSVGGGIFNHQSSPVLTNVTISGNSADQGGGMVNLPRLSPSNPQIRNSILWGNTAATAPTILNSSSTPTVSYSIVEGSGGSGDSWVTTMGADGGNNLDTDPLFLTAITASAPTTAGDLRLRAGSPAIDAGDNTAVPAGVTTDLAGDPRYHDDPGTPDTGSGTPPIVDLGAYEFQGTTTAAPVITRQPEDQTATAGTDATFTVAASGNPTPTVQWQASTNSGATWTDISGATSTTLTHESVSLGMSGYQYRAVFTNPAGSATSNSATLTVNPASVAPTITSADSTTFIVGTPGSFTVTATGYPVPTLSLASGTLPDGVSFEDNADGTATLSGTPAVGSADTYSFTITAANSVGTVSQAFTLTVNPAVEAPAITSTSTTTFTIGTSGSFLVTATGDPTPRLSMSGKLPRGVSFDASQGVLGGTPANGTAGTYLLTFTASNGVAPDATQAFSLIVSRTGGAAPLVTLDPSDQTVLEGETATFRAEASGDPAPTVQWQESGDGGKSWSNVSGATSTTLTLSDVTPSMNGYRYRALFTNTLGSATTKVATLTVNAAPVITLHPSPQSALEGGAASFSAAATGNPTPTVQWEVCAGVDCSWSPISGATSTTLPLSGVTPDMSGNQYRAVFANSAGSAETNPATLTVNAATGPGSIGGKLFDDANGNGVLDDGEGGLAGWSVQLQDAIGSVVATAQADAGGSYSFTGLDAATYRVRLMLQAGYIQTTADPADVAIANGNSIGGIDFGAVVSADLKVEMVADYNSNTKTIVYTITVTNDGPAGADRVVLTDALPSGVSYESATSTVGTCSFKGRTLTCDLGTLASGGSARITLKVSRTDTKKAITNTATVSAGTFDIDRSNNSATVTVP
jgi:uncharacterized repeat protein (TIGR01451 family)